MTISKKENLNNINTIKKILAQDANKNELTKKEILFAKCFIGYGMNENYVRKIIEQMKALGLVVEKTDCFKWMGELL